jgi:ketosteroid isomerase-like protein
MSEENVEIVRTMIDTWEEQGLDATITAFDPDVEVVDLQSAMGMKDRARGPEGLRRLAEQWTEIVSFHGVGRDSGTPVSNTQFELYRLVEGKIVEMRVGFYDREEALAWVRRRERVGGAV